MNGYDANETDLFPDERASVRTALEPAFAPTNGLYIRFVGFERCAPEGDADLRVALVTSSKPTSPPIRGTGRIALLDLDRCQGLTAAQCAGFVAVEEVAFAAGGGEGACYGGALTPVAAARIHGMYLPPSEVLAHAFVGIEFTGTEVALGAGRVPWLTTSLGDEWQSLLLAPGASVDLFSVVSNVSWRQQVASTAHLTGDAATIPNAFDGLADVSDAVTLFSERDQGGTATALPAGSYFEGSTELSAIVTPRQGSASDTAGVRSLHVPAGLAIELCDEADAHACRTYTEDASSLPHAARHPRYVRVVPTVVAYEEPYFRGRHVTLLPGAFADLGDDDLSFAELRSYRVGTGLRVTLQAANGAQVRTIDDSLGGALHVPAEVRSQIALLDVGYLARPKAIVDPSLVTQYSDPASGSCAAGEALLVGLASGTCDVRVDGKEGHWRGQPLVPDAPIEERNSFCRFTWHSHSGAAADVSALPARLDLTTAVNECATSPGGASTGPVAQVDVDQEVPVSVSLSRVSHIGYTLHNPYAPLPAECIAPVLIEGPPRDPCPDCSHSVAMIRGGDAYVTLSNPRMGTVALQSPSSYTAVTVNPNGAQTFVVRNAFPGVVRGTALVE
jgi:hypothetical protein